MSSETNLRDLLSHATGIPDNFIPLMAVLPESLTREELAQYVSEYETIHS